MNLIKNFKIDKNKIREFSIVLTTLFLITTFLYLKFINGTYIFASGDYLAPKMISESIKSLIEKYGEYPYWLPSIFGGMPTIHSLQNISDYYMPNYILSILKILSIPEIWTQLIHLIFAGLGVYILLRSMKIDFLVSLFGAILFLMAPYMNVCIVHGHGSQIMTASYIPWICFSLFKLSKKQNLNNLGLLGIFLGFQLQRGHIQIAYYTWIMIGIFILYKIITSKLPLKFYYYLIISLTSGFLMAISILWPSYKYSEYSIRSLIEGGAGLNYATGWSFTFKEMITFILPSFYGFGGQTYWGNIEPAMTDFPNYLGFFVFIFMIYGIVISLKEKTNLYFIIISIFFLLLSLGKNFFLFEILFNYLPFFNKFRVPMMALMIFQFSAIILSSLGLNSFIKMINNKNTKILKNFIIIMGTLSLLLIVFKFIFLNSINIRDDIEIAVKNMIHFDLNKLLLIIFSAFSLCLLLLYNTIKISFKSLPVLIIILSIFDMYFINQKIIDNPYVVIQANKNKMSNSNNWEENLSNEEKFRIICPEVPKGNSNWAGFYNLEDIHGYHPAKLKNYGKLERYKQYPNIYRNFAQLMNVKYMFSWYDRNGQLLDSPNITPTKDFLNSVNRIFFIDSLKQYTDEQEFLFAMNQEIFDPEKLSYTESKIPIFTKSNKNSKINIKKWTPNKIIIESNLIENHFVGLSEIYYPNWEITSHNIKIIEVNGLLRGFVAPKGVNTIIMEFNYNDIKYSSILSFISFFIMLFCALSTFLSRIKINNY